MRALLTIAVLIVTASPSDAAELHVGPGKKYPTPVDALRVAKPGDVISIHPRPKNAPWEQVALSVDTPRITIRGAEERQRVRISGKGFVYSGRGRTPRAIVQLNRGADDCVIENLELFGANNASHNGAGIRINQANSTIIRNCEIHSNDMGIMSAGDGTEKTAADQRIESCLIRDNGDLENPGYNHNLYLGGTSVTLVGCEIRSSKTGHNIKSRAHRLVMVACYVHDSANREFDLVDAKGDTDRPGSDAFLVGNIIEKANPCRGNRSVIHFGQDGGAGREGVLWLVHNTIVTPYRSAVIELSTPHTTAKLSNNIFWDGGNEVFDQQIASRRAIQSLLGSNNWFSSGFVKSLSARPQLGACTAEQVPPFADPGAGDYRLVKSHRDIVDRGVPRLSRRVRDATGGRLLEYVHPLGTTARLSRGKPDLGAYELTGP